MPTGFAVWAGLSHGLAQRAAAPEAASGRAKIVRIKSGRLGLRAGAASRAIVVQPFLAIVPGRCQLGMADAATANKRELDWLDLVHYSTFHFFQASAKSHANFCCAL